MNISSKIEALLFFKGEPLTYGDMARMLNASESEVREGTAALSIELVSRGITLVESNETVMLATSPEASEMITRITKEELEREPGKAGMEVLAIVLYQGPVTRAQIDYIRGVNSTFALRQLMVRGLIERIDNPLDQRSFLYEPSLQLLSFLGVSSTKDLPDFEAVRDMLTPLATEDESPEADSVESTDDTSSDA